MLRTLTLLACTAALAGCAAFNTLTASVSSYGEWPAGRKPGTYAFERLPSQEARADAQQQLEDTARRAMADAGFTEAAPGATPDVLAQLGARITRTAYSPWDDPLWWHGGFGPWRRGPWRGPYWGASMYSEPTRYDREVALLLRDRDTGKPLFETRASTDGTSAGGAQVLGAMFRAAMVDFPRTGVNPRQVSVPLDPTQPAR